MDDERAAIRAGLIEKGVFRLSVVRNKVAQTVISTYATNPCVHEMEIKVSFGDERGLDHGGLGRELIDCFWDEMEQSMDGRNEKVPQVHPANGQDFFHIGRFISHSYITTGYFPLMLSYVCTKVILCGEESVCEDELVSAFYEFIDEFEAKAARKCIEGEAEGELETVVIPMLSRFQIFSKPTSVNLADLIVKAARYAFITKPFYALTQIRRGLLKAHPLLWRRCTTPALVVRLYDMLRPTVPLVWAMIEEPSLSTPAKDVTFDYLRRFIHSLSAEMLKKFLRFVTGMSVCSNKKITVQFNLLEGFQQRPTSHTCSQSLHLPVTYTGYTAFQDHFMSILNNSTMWYFDSL